MTGELTRIQTPEYRASFLGSATLEMLGVESADAISILNDWQQTGAETYVTDFILKNGQTARHLIAKACIKFCPGEAMAEWIARRELLESKGVKVPELVATDRGTLVEEYIPFSLKEAFDQAPIPVRGFIRAGFVDTYKRVIGAGFKPMSFHDVRSRGDDVVMIDFGEDLGAPMDIDSCSLGIVVDAERIFRDITKG